MVDRIWSEEIGEGPLVAVALHDGHRVREDIVPYLVVAGDDRLREEDPFTGQWTRMAPTRVVGLQSRFEVDLNRTPDRAVYRRPDDAWGLGVWRPDVPPEVFETSLKLYHAFYARIEEILEDLLGRHGKLALFDLHTYNHRRPGPHRPAAPMADNPQIDVGTFRSERDGNAGIIDLFLDSLRAYDFPGGPLDVRENIRFPIGPFAEWVHRRFPERVCAFSIEVKKFFMDEWTGVADRTLLDAIEASLSHAAGEVSRLLGHDPAPVPAMSGADP